MFDRIINILIVDDHQQDAQNLKSLMPGSGCNVFLAYSIADAERLMAEKSFVLFFCSLDIANLNLAKFITEVERFSDQDNPALILTSHDKGKAYDTLANTHSEIVLDYLLKPFVSKLVKAKVNVYRKVHFKHKRIHDLLEFILPANTLKEFSRFGKSSPKRKEDCTILFTDFVNFTGKTKNLEPKKLIEKLDYFFSHFDAIILKYGLEKIKTIGDAYMAVGGVTEQTPMLPLRTALAALEIRHFMETDIQMNKALNHDFWEIRIGIHVGDLVAGVVGNHKFAFDVWGDSVNTAARCEQNSLPGRINISEKFAQEIAPYFSLTDRGPIPIKNGGLVDMYFLDDLKPAFAIQPEGIMPTVELRKKAELPLADFEGLRQYIIMKLKAELSDKLCYHSITHTLNVERAATKYAELEQLDEHQTFLLKTAALFHDSGFLFRYENNEELAVKLFRSVAPNYGYQPDDMDEVEAIIMCTAKGNDPVNLTQAIMRDADLDYLGRMDYKSTATKLFEELKNYGTTFTEKDCLIEQLDYLQHKHQYYTTSAKNIRGPGKERRITELKEKLKGF